MAASGRKEQLQNELNLQNQLVATAKTHLFLSEKGRDVKEELLGKLKEETDLGNQITDIQKAIDDLLLEQINRGDTVNQNYIDQLDRMKEILELKKQQKDKEEEINDLGKDFKDSLLGSLGTMGDMLKAGTAFGAGMVLAKKATEMLSDAFESTVGLSKELYTQTGATAAESARVGAETMKSMFSMEGLLYGGEALATAAKSTADYYGSTSSNYG
jgi:DNA mismatch repair ATPase MutS